MVFTPNRSIRIPEALWRKVKIKAMREHTTATAIIISLLVKWIDE